MLLLLSAMGYAAAVMWLIGQEARLVFQAGSTLATGRPPFPYEQIDVPRDDGAAQFAWAMPAEDLPIRSGCCICTATRRASLRR